MRTRGGLNGFDDFLVYRSDKLFKVNDSFAAFINDMRADGMNFQDILEIIEMMKRRR